MHSVWLFYKPYATYCFYDPDVDLVLICIGSFCLVYAHLSIFIKCSPGDRVPWFFFLDEISEREHIYL